MSNSDSENDNNFSDLSDFEYEFDDDGITHFLFEPMYTEEEIEERVRRHESGELLIDRETESRKKPCCNEVLEARLEEFDSKNCVTETRPFGLVCLEKDVFETALGNKNRMVGDNRDVCNKSYRFIAHRQYISWIYGKLEKGVRMQIPNSYCTQFGKRFLHRIMFLNLLRWSHNKWYQTNTLRYNGKIGGPGQWNGNYSKRTSPLYFSCSICFVYEVSSCNRLHILGYKLLTALVRLGFQGNDMTS